MHRAALQFRDERPEIDLVFLGARDPARSSLPGRLVEAGAFDGSERAAGEISVAAIRAGTELCLAGKAAALVTGPVSKPALHLAGCTFRGQTEFLQSLTASPGVGMLMHAERTRGDGPPLRILLATTHLALREVPAALTTDRLTAQLRLLDHALRSGWGFERPRIALCALNPHASDGGLFGDEEARIMQPVVERLQGEGLAVDGPFPADTVFLRALDGRADAIVVPGHDVGMAVFKTLAFGSGVNVTLGLPFPRTSPDHGTAFDLVGTGKADFSSTLEAMRLAARLAF